MAYADDLKDTGEKFLGDIAGAGVKAFGKADLKLDYVSGLEMLDLLAAVERRRARAAGTSTATNHGRLALP